MPTTSTIEPKAEAPDWQAVTADVHCAMCGYNLRGLVEPRCPECGREFEWASVLIPDRRAHPFLFERHTNVRGFVRTTLAAMNPWRFWSSIAPVEPLRPLRLGVFWLATVLVWTMVFAAAHVPEAVRTLNAERSFPAYIGGITPQVPPEAKFTFGIADVPSVVYRCFCGRQFLPFWSALLFEALLPVFSLASLLVFQTTMRRAKVLPAHVMRCIAYGFNPALWLSIYCLAAIVGWLPDPRLIPPSADLLFILSVPAGMLITGTISLGIAYRRYLGFPQAWMTVVIAQVVAVLGVIAAASLLRGI